MPVSNERQKRLRGVDFYAIDIKKETNINKREKRHVLKKIMRLCKKTQIGVACVKRASKKASWSGFLRNRY